MKSAEQSREQDFVRCNSQRENGTLRTVDFILMLLAANWNKMCSGRNICVRSKRVLNAPVKGIF